MCQQLYDAYYMPGTKYFAHVCSSNPSNGPYEVGAFMIHILWMKKPRQEEVTNCPVTRR